MRAILWLFVACINAVSLEIFVNLDSFIDINLIPNYFIRCCFLGAGALLSTLMCLYYFAKDIKSWYLALLVLLLYFRVEQQFLFYFYHNKKSKNSILLIWKILIIRIFVYLFNSSTNILFNICGFAFPFVVFIACPTKNPNALSLPFL